MMSDTNRETLRSYEGHIDDYIEGTAQVVSGEAKDWIDAALAGLPAGAGLLELGSAFGRDAAYIAAQGFDIDCTDAAPGFVSYLRARGFAARHFNVLTDGLERPYDLILANAVFVHFDRGEFAFVLAKLRAALRPEGRLAFSLKRGAGEEWSSAKIGAPRFFCYWQPDDVAAHLAAAGFARWSITSASTSRAHAEWLFVIAEGEAIPPRLRPCGCAGGPNRSGAS
jgi:SAM-dependent methyltransferase